VVGFCVAELAKKKKNHPFKCLQCRCVRDANFVMFLQKCVGDLLPQHRAATGYTKGQPICHLLIW